MNKKWCHDWLFLAFLVQNSMIEQQLASKSPELNFFQLSMIKGICFAVISVEKIFPNYSHFCATGTQNGLFPPKCARFLQVTSFWLQWVAQTYFLRNFSMEMYSLVQLLLNISIFIKIGRELACLWHPKVFIEIKRKKLIFAHFYAIFTQSFAQIIMKTYYFII